MLVFHKINHHHDWSHAHGTYLYQMRSIYTYIWPCFMRKPERMTTSLSARTISWLARNCPLFFLLIVAFHKKIQNPNKYREIRFDCCYPNFTILIAFASQEVNTIGCYNLLQHRKCNKKFTITEEITSNDHFPVSLATVGDTRTVDPFGGGILLDLEDYSNLSNSSLQSGVHSTKSSPGTPGKWNC